MTEEEEKAMTCSSSSSSSMRSRQNRKGSSRRDLNVKKRDCTDETMVQNQYHGNGERECTHKMESERNEGRSTTVGLENGILCEHMKQHSFTQKRQRKVRTTHYSTRKNGVLMIMMLAAFAWTTFTSPSSSHHAHSKDIQRSSFFFQTPLFAQAAAAAAEVDSEEEYDESEEENSDTTTTTRSDDDDKLNENSVVLITGAAGFIGSELAMALHRVYNVKQVLCIDIMDVSLTASADPSTSTPPVSSKMASAAAKEKVEEFHSKSEKEMALFEFKRQRLFHMMQTLGPRGTFYRADFRPSMPEFFDMGEVPILDTIFRTHLDITHVVHLADPYHGGATLSDNNDDDASMSSSSSSGGYSEGGRLLTQAVPRVKEQLKSGMMEALLEQLKKVSDQRGSDKVPHFIYASSYEVYDHLNMSKEHPNPPPFREDKPITTPSSLRGASKLIDEILAFAYHDMHSIFSLGLRFFPVYGPWGLPGTPIFEMAERAVSDPQKAIIPDLNTATAADPPSIYDSRDYVYIDDAIDAILMGMQYRPPPPGRKQPSPSLVINVGTGVSSTLQDIGNQMEKHFPRSDSSVVSPKKQKSDKSPTLSTASNERAEALLGFKPRVTLEEGLAKTMAWHYDRAFPYGGRPHPIQSSHGNESCHPHDRECLHGAPVFPCESECANENQCIRSYYEPIAPITREITKQCSAVLYTVSLGNDVTNIPSASKAVSSLSVSHLKGGGGSNNDDYETPQSHCNIAFVSENSVLVQKLKQEFPLRNSASGIPDGYIDQHDQFLRHGFWTLIPINTPSYTSSSDNDDDDVLVILPKISPGFFFGGGMTQHAIYADPDVLFTDVEKLLRQAQMQPKTDGGKGATAMMVGKARERPPKQNNSRSYSSVQREAVQQRAYNSIRIALRGLLVGGGVAPLIDTSWIVHRLDSVEDARLFRCDVYGEIVQWNVSADELAMEFVLGLHDMWSGFIVRWSGGEMEPWWKKTTNVVPEGNQFMGGKRVPDVQRRRLTDIPREFLSNHAPEGKFYNEVQQKQERRKLSIPLHEEGEDVGSWLGVLSSSNTQYFVRIMPSSAVGVVHLDEYVY